METKTMYNLSNTQIKLFITRTLRSFGVDARSKDIKITKIWSDYWAEGVEYSFMGKTCELVVTSNEYN